MITEQQHELIQRAVDGELDQAERAEFDALLEQSDEARALYTELKSVDSLLRGLPSDAPPPDLRGRILEAIEPPRRVAEPDPSLPAFLRYGLAASVGLMIAVAFYESGPQLAAPGTDDMIGTMAPRGDARTVQVNAIGAKAALHAEGDTRLLELEWNSPDDVEIVVELGGSGLGFDAMARAQGAPDHIEVSGSALRVSGRGQHRVIARLKYNERGVTDDAVIHIEFFRDGSPISRERLAAD